MNRVIITTVCYDGAKKSGIFNSSIGVFEEKYLFEFFDQA